MSEYKDIFSQQGFCTVESAISPELRDFVTQYALFDEHQNFEPDKKQVLGAHCKYGDPAMEVMLLHLKKQMENSTNLLLYPTYSFYRVYRPGDELVVHKDRPSCEISCTLCLNYNYNDANYQWPLFVENTPVYQKPGDLIVYRGCELNHWREPFEGSEGDWHVQAFFHYVDVNGPFSEYKFDKRSMIGEKRASIETVASQKSYITYL